MMDFLREKQMILYLNAEFDGIYKFFQAEYGMPYTRLFILTAALGFSKSSRKKFSNKGREFRSNYLEKNESFLCYSILLNEIGSIFYENIQSLSDDANYSEARKILEEYSNGGMVILIDEVFGAHWDGENLSKNYDDYLLDMIDYILNASTIVPF